MRSAHNPEALIATITREMGFSPSTARVWKHRGIGVPLTWRAEIQSRAIRDHDIALPHAVYEHFGRERIAVDRITTVNLLALLAPIPKWKWAA